MPYALDEQGRPLMLVSTMAMHTQNLAATRRQPARDAVDAGDPLARGGDGDG